jgi:rhamnogalacturonan endolyase
MRCFLLAAVVACLISPAHAAAPVVREKIDRGLAARPMAAGKVYVSWRLLADDPADAAFNVYRSEAGGKPVRLNEAPIAKTTDFVDAAAPKSQLGYAVRLVSGGKESADLQTVEIDAAAEALPYKVIKLDGDHTVQKVALADLTGDGRYDFVVKQPNSNVDPYINYWKRSPGTFKLEAYSSDGKLLWRHDLGWSIEQGIWYSPYVVHDLDGDGKAEVAVKTGEGDPRDADGRVTSGPEYLTILNGATGRPLTRVDWPTREGFGTPEQIYNYSSRNQLCVAYLDGKTPSLIVNRGTYNLIKLVAYQLKDKQLVEQWRWDNSNEDRKYWGSGAHWMQAFDANGNGRDEILVGSFVVDGAGKSLWATGLRHPDHAYVGDLDPTRPGLEIYFGIETQQKQRNGMCMVDAATGNILWGLDKPTRHVHSHGMCSDIDPAHPGSECYSADTDEKKDFAFGLLHSAQGKLLAEENLAKFGPRTVYWDATPQRALLMGRQIVKYKGDTLGKIEGTYVASVDLNGDWREEILATLPGELRIYGTTIPAQNRRVCLMQDPIYRMNVTVAAMGYYQVPMLSYDMASEKPR